MLDSSSIDNDVRLQIFAELISRAAAPTVAEAARGLGLDESSVGAAYDRLSAARVIVLRSGTRDVLMAAPFSAVPTRHVVKLTDGRSYYGNCVWDALGVLAMLRADGDVVTSCADCEMPLRLAVRDNALEPSSTVVHFAVPPAQWWADIVFT